MPVQLSDSSGDRPISQIVEVVTPHPRDRLRPVGARDNVFGFNAHGDFVIRHPSGSSLVMEANGNVVVTSARNLKAFAEGKVQFQPEAWDDPDIGQASVNPDQALTPGEDLGGPRQQAS